MARSLSGAAFMPIAHFNKKMRKNVVFEHFYLVNSKRLGSEHISRMVQANLRDSVSQIGNLPLPQFSFDLHNFPVEIGLKKAVLNNAVFFKFTFGEFLCKLGAYLS